MTGENYLLSDSLEEFKKQLVGTISPVRSVGSVKSSVTHSMSTKPALRGFGSVPASSGNATVRLIGAGVDSLILSRVK
jgi:hypothetical protein